MPNMTIVNVRLYPGGPWVQVPALIGPVGPQGERGEMMRVEDVYPTLAALRAAFPSGNNNMYLVEENNECYVWSETENDWVSVGSIQGPPGDDGADGADGITPTIDATTKHWMIGDTDTGIVAEGQDGADGQDGAPGADGQDGVDGITPTIGDNGNWYLGDTDTGKPSRGIKGDTGAQGPQGIQGIQGVAGSAATIQVGTVTSGTTPSVTNSGTSAAAVFNFVLPKGDKGDTGETGATGPQGPQGIQGLQGATGPQGLQGPQGVAGTSAYTAAQSAGYTGTEAQFNSDLAAIGSKISTSDKGVANGVASLGSDGKVPSTQLPSMNYIPTSQKGAANGVASLGIDGKVPSTQLPDIGGLKVEYQSYVGTGTYGISSPCQVSFSFAPKLVLLVYWDSKNIVHGYGENGSTSLMYPDLMTTSWQERRGFSRTSPSYGYGKKSADGKTFYWYNTNSADSQYNRAGTSCKVMAIG